MEDAPMSPPKGSEPLRDPENPPTIEKPRSPLSGEPEPEQAAEATETTRARRRAQLDADKKAWEKADNIYASVIVDVRKYVVASHPREDIKLYLPVEDSYFQVPDLSIAEKMDEERPKFKKRPITHPLFENVSREEAVSKLADSEIGSLIIRPSSRGYGFLAVSWKWCQRDELDYAFCVSHLTLREDNPKEARLGDSLTLAGLPGGRVEEFEDLDEFVSRFMRPLVAIVKNVYRSNKYRTGSRAEVEQALTKERAANPKRIPYALARNFDAPAHFHLYYHTSKCRRLRVSASSDGLRIGPVQKTFASAVRLIDYFKRNSKDIEKAVKTAREEAEKARAAAVAPGVTSYADQYAGYGGADAYGQYDPYAQGAYAAGGYDAAGAYDPNAGYGSYAAAGAYGGYDQEGYAAAGDQSAYSEQYSQQYTYPNAAYAATGDQSAYSQQYSQQYADPNAAYADPNAAYADPNAAYADPNAAYADPNAAYADPNTAYADPNAAYADPNAAYPDPNAVDPNAAAYDPDTSAVPKQQQQQQQ